MPETEVVYYREDDGSVPLDDWLATLPVAARRSCLDRIEFLAEMGHELRRPHAEYLPGTKLHELRVKFYRVNYRMLYFFHGRTIAVISQGFSKERRIPRAEIELATERMARFLADPDQHSFRPEA